MSADTGLLTVGVQHCTSNVHDIRQLDSQPPGQIQIWALDGRRKIKSSCSDDSP